MILDDCIEVEIDGVTYGVTIVAYHMGAEATRDEPECPAWVDWQLLGSYGQDVCLNLTKEQEAKIDRLCIEYLEREHG